MTNRSPLDDPRNAAHAWARYRRLMRAMALVTLVVILAVDGWLYVGVGDEPVSIHMYVAASLGVGITMMLMAALMGLVFLSSGTGHDESIDDRLDSSHWD